MVPRPRDVPHLGNTIGRNNELRSNVSPRANLPRDHQNGFCPQALVIISLKPSRDPFLSAPTGLRPLAQGCPCFTRATLGKRSKAGQPPRGLRPAEAKSVGVFFEPNAGSAVESSIVTLFPLALIKRPCNSPNVISEKGNIIEAPETAPRPCFSEQDSQGSKIARRREPTNNLKPSAASFNSRSSSLRQFGNCRRLSLRNWKRQTQQWPRELGDSALRLTTGNSFCFLTAAGSPRNVTGLQQAGLWDRPCAKESCLTQDSPRRDVVSRQGPIDHFAKTKMVNMLSGNPQSAVVTGRILGSAYSRRDPCTEISP